MADKIFTSTVLVLCFLMLVDSSNCSWKLLESHRAAPVQSQDSLLTASARSSNGDYIDYEAGVSVETVFDGNKLNISIHSISAVPLQDYVYAIDSAASQLLKIELPIDPDRKRLFRRIVGDGNGRRGYKDGWGEDALLDHPKGLVVDGDGNVYVADVRNRVIRRITPSGYVSTIAGQPNKTGHADGEGKNALFSADFYISYLPRRCSLLVSDRGNKRLRMIQLQPSQNCNQEKGYSDSPLALVYVLFVLTIVLASLAATLQFQKRELQRSVAAFLALDGEAGPPFNREISGPGGSVLSINQRVITTPLLNDPPIHLQRGRSLPDDISHVSSSNKVDLIDFSDSSQVRELSGRQHSLEASVADGSGAAEVDEMGRRLRSGQNADDSPAPVELSNDDAEDYGIRRRIMSGHLDDDGSDTPEIARIRSLKCDLVSDAEDGIGRLTSGHGGEGSAPRGRLRIRALECDLLSDSESRHTDPTDSGGDVVLGRSALTIPGKIEAERTKALQQFTISTGS